MMLLLMLLDFQLLSLTLLLPAYAATPLFAYDAMMRRRDAHYYVILRAADCLHDATLR